MPDNSSHVSKIEMQGGVTDMQSLRSGSIDGQTIKSIRVISKVGGLTSTNVGNMEEIVEPIGER